MLSYVIKYTILIFSVEWKQNIPHEVDLTLPQSHQRPPYGPKSEKSTITPILTSSTANQQKRSSTNSLLSSKE